MIRDFARVAAALAKRPGVTKGKMFGAEGMKVNGSVFAMEVKGRLVVKLSVDRAAAMRDEGLASAFDPGHGRPMKQWVTVEPTAKVDWLTLSLEAYDFVRS